jgi:hypothetical protein
MYLLQLGKDFYKVEFEEAEKATEEAVKEVKVCNSSDGPKFSAFLANEIYIHRIISPHRGCVHTCGMENHLTGKPYDCRMSSRRPRTSTRSSRSSLRALMLPVSTTSTIPSSHCL